MADHTSQFMQRSNTQPGGHTDCVDGNVVEADPRGGLLWMHHRRGHGYARLDDWMLEDIRCVHLLVMSGHRNVDLCERRISGEINVPNLALPYSAVCSGLTGLLVSGLITVFVSLASTYHPRCDWKIL